MSLIKRVEELNQNMSMNAIGNILLDMAQAIERLSPPERIEMSATSDIAVVKPVIKKGRPKKNV
jgi:hypothetical protein